MKTPFTAEQFFNVFEQYNQTVFPAQLIFLILGFAGLILLHSKNVAKNKWIGLLLGILWIWTGLIYQIAFFSRINKVAIGFGGMFILQGILITMNALRNRLSFSTQRQAKDYFDYFFVIFGLLIYPVISYFMEGSPERTISLGLPCPTVIFTLGFFMLTDKKFPKYLLVIPSLWAIIGLSAAINFGVYQDFMILIAAIFSYFSLSLKKRSV